MDNTQKIIITGVPNTGKSTLFSRITKEYSMSANYPHTTVEEQKAKIRLKNKEYELVDTPGINSLDIFSEDELLVRDILLKEKPSIIIQCVDTVNIKRSLFLTSQLIELDIPIIICLNFIDESQAKGVWVNSKKLENMFKVPVVEVIANQEKGIDELITRILHARLSNHRVEYPRDIREAMDRVVICFSNPPSPAVLLLILSQKKDIFDWIENKYGKDVLIAVRKKIKDSKILGLKNVSNRVLKTRNMWVENVAQEIVHKSQITTSPVSEKIGEFIRHPIWGWPILLGIVYITYFLVGRVGAITIAGFFDENIFIPLTDFISKIIQYQFLREFFVGDYGVLTIGLFNALGTVLPILFMFFIILGFLEDTGYIPSLCVLINRFFKKIGLSGKSVLPIMLGFGCKTMATLTTKSLDSRKERYIAIFLIAFAIPCSAQLGIYIAMLALLPFSAFIITFGVFMLIEITAGYVLDKTIKSDKASCFIMELSPIRFPNLKNLLIKVYYRLSVFLKEAIPLFLIGALVLFVMDKIGVLTVIKKGLSPIIVSFLSLPVKAVEAYLLCLSRHEQGAMILMDMARSQQLGYIQIIVGIIIITIPCFATVMAMIKQLKFKSALITVGVINTSAILVGGAVNWILRLAG
jgi:ferrous iron transport protein B